MEFRPQMSASNSVSDDVGVRIDDGLDLFEGPGIRLRSRTTELEYLNKCQIRVENYNPNSTGKDALSEGTSMYAQGINVEKASTGGISTGYHRSVMFRGYDDANYPVGAYAYQYGLQLTQNGNGAVMGGINYYGIVMNNPEATGFTNNRGIVQTSLYADGNIFNGDLLLRNEATDNIKLHANATGTDAYIWCRGDIVAYHGFSDKRLKKNIEYLDQKECLDKILKLDGVSFNWIDTDTDQSRQIGFIAQETEKIIPEVIKVRVNPAEEGKKFKKMNYDKLTPYLVEAIKEQQDMINDLKTEINILKNRIGD
jgi:hypothetical protein